MNGKDFAIGILSVTAVILLTGLIIVHALLPQSAMAFGQNAAAGDYLVTTSQLNDRTELVVIVNTDTEQLNVYFFDPQLGQIQLLQPPIPIVRQDERRGVRPNK